MGIEKVKLKKNNFSQSMFKSRCSLFQSKVKIKNKHDVIHFIKL